MNAERGRTLETSIVSLDADRRTQRHDVVVTEEPLEIRLLAGGSKHTLAVTMRTPGNDFELAAGFALGEGIVRDRAEIEGIGYCLDSDVASEQRYNVVNVSLRRNTLPDLSRFERHFTVNSSCGVCGRAHLDSLHDLGVAPLDDGIAVPAATLYRLPGAMRSSQHIFERTGGLHAAALFDASGTRLATREDIGRHNALDKLVGWAVLEGRFPLSGCILVVSGRASYEILQKSAVARIPIVCSVSAPSGLAVELAREFGITLVGFLRGERANVYSVPERVTR